MDFYDKRGGRVMARVVSILQKRGIIRESASPDQGESAPFRE